MLHKLFSTNNSSSPTQQKQSGNYGGLNGLPTSQPWGGGGGCRGGLVYFCLGFLFIWIEGRGVAGDGDGRQLGGGEVACDDGEG